MKRERLLEILNGYEPAVDFIESIFAAAHFWDDLIDRDQPISDDEINKQMWNLLVDLPSNPFYQQFFAQLQPLVVNAIANWHAANRFERGEYDQDALEVAFVIRSDYANILIQTAYLVGGRESVLAATPYIRRYWTRDNFTSYLLGLEHERTASKRGVE